MSAAHITDADIYSYVNAHDLFVAALDGELCVAGVGLSSMQRSYTVAARCTQVSVSHCDALTHMAVLLRCLCWASSDSVHWLQMLPAKLGRLARVCETVRRMSIVYCMPSYWQVMRREASPVCEYNSRYFHLGHYCMFRMLDHDPPRHQCTLNGNPMCAGSPGSAQGTDAAALR